MKNINNFKYQAPPNLPKREEQPLFSFPLGKLGGVIILIILTLLSCTENKIKKVENINLIPLPQKMELKNDGAFLFSNNTDIITDKSFEKEATYLKEFRSKKRAGVENTIEIIKVENFKKEEYKLNITPNKIEIKATFPEGVMRAIQTLRQIFPPNYEKEKNPVQIPTLSIHDSPRFPWRGMLLDCSRHFMEKEFVMRYIDLLALHKMNTLHWHITDDQGWRIEIDKYPKLTEIGAWRTEKDGIRYGGFYTKEDIAEIVAYAQERHINIVPEIELPGHCTAALAAYPELACTDGPFEVETDWGVFKDIYCVGKDTVFVFLENVLDEVMEMFPSPYIHIGGDEVPKYRWEQSELCQALKKREGLKDEHELQSYFIKRIEQHLNKNGRQLIGWDEILEGGLAPSAVVQSWRGMNGGIEAAKTGHYAIMSPTSHCYFDYDLDAIDMEKVYSFDPIPEELTAEEAQFILGGECNMWSERAPQDKVDSKVFPRILAMSEILWTDKDKQNYNDFYERTQQHYTRLEALGVDYGYESVPISSDVVYEDGKFDYTLQSAIRDIKIEYQIDSGEWTTYEQPFQLDKTTSIHARGTKNGKPYGTFSQTVHHSNSTGKKVNYKNPFHENYASSGENALTDGLKGTDKFRDGYWQGFFGEDMEIIIDLGKEHAVSEVSIGAYQYNLSWIMLPEYIEIQLSNDGKSFKNFGKTYHEISPKQEGQFFHEFNIPILTTMNVCYVKVIAKNYGKLPEWHPAAGADAWLFVDEVLVR